MASAAQQLYVLADDALINAAATVTTAAANTAAASAGDAATTVTAAASAVSNTNQGGGPFGFVADGFEQFLKVMVVLGMSGRCLQIMRGVREVQRCCLHAHALRFRYAQQCFCGLRSSCI